MSERPPAPPNGCQKYHGVPGCRCQVRATKDQPHRGAHHCNDHDRYWTDREEMYVSMYLTVAAKWGAVLDAADKAEDVQPDEVIAALRSTPATTEAHRREAVRRIVLTSSHLTPDEMTDAILVALRSGDGTVATPAASPCRHDDQFIEEFTAQVIEAYEQGRSTPAAPQPDPVADVLLVREQDQPQPDTTCPDCTANGVLCAAHLRPQPDTAPTCTCDFAPGACRNALCVCHHHIRALGEGR